MLGTLIAALVAVSASFLFPTNLTLTVPEASDTSRDRAKKANSDKS
ncbi:MAG: hypothetical protein ACTH3D_08505 [Halomonas sp.]